MTDEFKETDYEVVEPVSEEDEATESQDEVTEPETVETEPALDPDVETIGVVSATVTENPISDEEREVQEAHEALAEELAPGETLPWVAPTPSAAQPPEIIAPDPTDTKEPASDIPSSRHESAENAPDTE